MAVNEVRRQRVATTMRKLLAEMLPEIRHRKIEAAGLATINHVELNVDLSIARVYVSFFGGDPQAAGGAVAVLDERAGSLRGRIGRKLGMRHAPELRFVNDQSPDFQQRLADIIADDERRHVDDHGEEE